MPSKKTESKPETRIVYTAQPLEGVAWDSVDSRVAKERLRAVIEESLIPNEVVKSYTITDHETLGFPHREPDVDSLIRRGFFGKRPSIERVQRELGELYEQPKREYAVHEARVRTELANATDEKILGMVLKYNPHGTTQKDIGEFRQALATIKKLWLPFEQVQKELETEGRSNYRGQLSGTLETLRRYGSGATLEEIKKVRELLEAGKRDEAIERFLEESYKVWRVSNLAQLENLCYCAGDDAGYWMARMVAPSVGHDPSWGPVEKYLNELEMRYQVIKI